MHFASVAYFSHLLCLMCLETLQINYKFQKLFMIVTAYQSLSVALQITTEIV